MQRDYAIVYVFDNTGASLYPQEETIKGLENLLGDAASVNRARDKEGLGLLKLTKPENFDWATVRQHVMNYSKTVGLSFSITFVPYANAWDRAEKLLITDGKAVTHSVGVENFSR